MTAWATNLYTGLFTTFGTQRPRAHDPDLALCSGTMARWGRAGSGAQGSGIGWTAAEAEAACLGEAIERLQAAPLPEDRHVESRFQDWALDEPAVPPADWVLFHPAQYAQAGFPFRLFTPATICSWVCFREVPTGQPWWVPAEMAWLDLGPGCSHRLTAGVSTGLACGRPGQPLVLRGLHEAIERDAVVGAWWERYPLEEHGIDEVLARLGRSDARARLLRPNLRYKCFRIDSPFSDGVTLVALEGEDREGFIFSAGSACRETLALSWEKALLEAVHGRHYARYLKGEIVAGRRPALAVPISFADHAVYYSLHPERLRETVLARPSKRGSASVAGRHEGREELCERLGSRRPVLVRNMTPPALAREGLDWHVVRVLVPGLQPLHGSHPLAHLGGSLWAPRGLSDWVGQPPHPFP